MLPIYALCWPLGAIIGPILGGTFSNPADKFPLLDVPFLRQYPYALPCLVASTLSFLGVTLAYFLMEEVRRFLPSLPVIRFAHGNNTIDSSIKEKKNFKETQGGEALRICTGRPCCGSAVCLETIGHSVFTIIDYLQLRSLFRFYRL